MGLVARAFQLCGFHAQQMHQAPWLEKLIKCSTAKIEYIGQITDTAQFDELFIDVLAQRLAAEIGMALADNASMVKGLWDVYQAKLSEARLMDATEGTPREVVDLSPWIVARA